MNNDLRKVVTALEEQGFEVRVTRRGNVVVTRDGELVATFSASSVHDRPTCRTTNC